MDTNASDTDLRQAYPPSRATVVAGWTSCPGCGAPVWVPDRRCPTCGRALDATPPFLDVRPLPRASSTDPSGVPLWRHVVTIGIGALASVLLTPGLINATTDTDPPWKFVFVACCLAGFAVGLLFRSFAVGTWPFLPALDATFTYHDQPGYSGAFWQVFAACAMFIFAVPPTVAGIAGVALASRLRRARH